MFYVGISGGFQGVELFDLDGTAFSLGVLLVECGGGVRRRIHLL